MRLLDDIRMNHWAQIGPNMRRCLSETQVVVCDQVTEYYFAMNDKEYWDVEDFPNLMPPFKNFWLETVAPTRILSEEHGLQPWEGKKRPTRWGALFLEGDNDTAWTDPRIREFFPRQELEDNVKTWLNVTMFIDTATIFSPLWAWCVPIGKDGLIWVKYDTVLNRKAAGLSYSLLQEDRDLVKLSSATPESLVVYQNLRSEAHAYVHPLFLAVSFMHARNVTLTHHEPSARMNRKQTRAGRPPMLSYKVLEVGPIKKVIEAERHRSGDPSFSLAVHRCIGHFKTYTQDAPLLGKHAGTFFWAEQLRGKPQDGHAVRKEYHVKSVKEGK